MVAAVVVAEMELLVVAEIELLVVAEMELVVVVAAHNLYERYSNDD